MNKLGHRGPKNIIKIDMLISICKPLLASHNMSNSHLPIINYVCQMKSGHSIGSDNNKVIDRFKLKFTEHFVFESFWPSNQIRFNAYCVLFFRQYSLLYLLKSQTATLSIICISFRLLWIFFVLLVMAKARIRHVTLQ